MTMTLELFLALLTYAGIAAWTPGPNNTLLMASGITHGLRKTMPMIAGVAIGFPLMIFVISLGLGQVFQQQPILHTVLKFVGLAYMLWLAWKIASAKPHVGGGATSTQALGFFHMVLFQWVNPKAWIMAITSLSAYTVAENYTASALIVVATTLLMGITSATGWAAFGQLLGRFLADPKWFRVINISLAVALVLSLVPMLTQ
jgi:threonine/homoserine/homoserine lactone efflux protein